MRPANEIRLATPEIRIIADGVELSCAIEGLHARKTLERIWMRFHDVDEEWISGRSDAFLAALLPTAMATGRDLRVEGPISERLLRNTRQAHELLAAWHPALRRIYVHADCVAPPEPARGEIGAFFTCGVDSFHTVLESLESDLDPHRVDRLIFVEGFDVSLDDVTLLSRVRERVQTAAEEFALPLLVVGTNLREITDRSASWPDLQCGAALASVGLALSGLFSEVRISSSDVYSTLIPYGSHPMLDPLWSTESTRVHHAGCEATRIQKIDWRISRSPIALEHVRVCWENRDGRYNCGECEKCIRTMIALRAVGALERCTAFEQRTLDLEVLDRLGKKDLRLHEYLPHTIDWLEDTRRDPELLCALHRLSDRFAAMQCEEAPAPKELPHPIPYLRRMFRSLARS